jgi:outer membrane protein assembly factor BamD
MDGSPLLPFDPISGILILTMDFRTTTINWIRISLLGLLLGVFLSGCATEKDTVGSEVRDLLGIDENTTAITEGTLEQQYEPLTIMKRGESFYAKENYIEAAGEYQRFLELHPIHRLAPFAQFRLGMSYYKQINTVDRDSEPLWKTIQAFQKLLEVYPKSPYVADAKTKLAFCRERLAQYQMYIAHFYYHKGAYPAAIYRFNKVVKDYGDLEIASEALYRLALSYRELGQGGQAETTLRLLLEKYPDSRYRNEANGLIQRLNDKPAS